MARRRYQRGSLDKVGDRWIARWREDVRLPSGEVKRIRRKEILGSIEELETKKLAQRALDRRLEPINHEEYRPASTVTFALFADKWKKEIMIHHKLSSQSSEESIVDVHLVPFFGGDQCRNINAETVQRFVNESKSAPKTIKNHISLLMVMWDHIKAWGYAQHNPFPRGTNGRLLIKLPSIVKGKAWHRESKRWVDVFMFTAEQTLEIINKAKGKWQLFFRILAESGMRPGELAGLLITGCGARTLTISQSVWQQEVQTPKTENAVRTFAISQSLADEIHAFTESQPPNAYGLVFVTDPSPAKKGKKPRYPGGKPLSMDNFRNRVLNPIIDELGILAQIKALGVRGGNYAFRHMNATLMDGLHTPLKTRQKRLGHADVTTTLTHYSHAVDADDLAAADALGALLSPTKGEAVQ